MGSGPESSLKAEQLMDRGISRAQECQDCVCKLICSGGISMKCLNLLSLSCPKETHEVIVDIWLCFGICYRVRGGIQYMDNMHYVDPPAMLRLRSKL